MDYPAYDQVSGQRERFHTRFGRASASVLPRHIYRKLSVDDQLFDKTSSKLEAESTQVPMKGMDAFPGSDRKGTRLHSSRDTPEPPYNTPSSQTFST
jgi:hypothetical protein